VTHGSFHLSFFFFHNLTFLPWTNIEFFPSRGSWRDCNVYFVLWSYVFQICVSCKRFFCLGSLKKQLLSLSCAPFPLFFFLSYYVLFFLLLRNGTSAGPLKFLIFARPFVCSFAPGVFSLPKHSYIFLFITSRWHFSPVVLPLPPLAVFTRLETIFSCSPLFCGVPPGPRFEVPSFR